MKIINGSITAPQGFLAQGVCAAIKKKDKKDVAIIYSEKKATAAGVFTLNKVRAACIDFNQSKLNDGMAQAIVVNSGNANACTGEQGIVDTIRMAELSAECLEISPNDVLVASTGVIGVYMPMERIEAGIIKAASALSKEGADYAAKAIMTTDLIEKEIAVEIKIQGHPVKIGAIAKGSGMIHPNMATMLAFITTDVAINNKCLQESFKQSNNRSYNMISVDGDTSTNDMALILANGMAGNPEINEIDSADYQVFQQALDYINISLAKMIARDGEGATHLLEVQVVNVADEESARQIARTVTTSNLTKAAVFGKDANWGRIFAAAGRAGVDFDQNLVDIYLGAEKMAENGMGLIFDEDKALAELEKENVIIKIDLKSGEYSATAWGCDLSYDYVRINADYRT